MTETTSLVFPALGRLYRALAPFTEPLIRLCAGLSMAAHGYARSTEDLDLATNGLFTRIAAVPLLIFLLTALDYHRQFGFYWDTKGFEYPLFWALVVLHFLVHGGGRWSADGLIGREV